jgi:DNA-binding beta-propeller fold protein YncE
MRSRGWLIIASLVLGAGLAFLSVKPPAQGAPAATGIISTIAGTGKAGYSGDGGRAPQAQLNQPFHADVDNAGNLYVADALNHCVRKINLRTGVILTVAGTGKGGFSGDHDNPLKAWLNEPYAVAVDTNGDLYIVDRRNVAIRKVDSRKGIITTVASSESRLGAASADDDPPPPMREPNDCCLDHKGGLLIADVGDGRVRRLDFKTGALDIFAGTGKPQGRVNRRRIGDGGPAIEAVLEGPRAVCVDGQGNTYICEREGNAIRKVDSRGIITTIAGTGQKGYTGDDGDARKATFNGPKGLRCDRAGNLYVVDTENHAIRRIDRNLIVTTVAGGRRGAGGDQAKATRAGLDRPHGCIVDDHGNLYIADTNNHRIRSVRLP